jgi:hypothetical protein
MPVPLPRQTIAVVPKYIVDGELRLTKSLGAVSCRIDLTGGAHNSRDSIARHPQKRDRRQAAHIEYRR